MADDKHIPDGQEPGGDDPAISLNPEERAFTGHPDHPPASPDQSVEGNEELLRGSDDAETEGAA